MAKVSPIQSSFTGGEFSPLVYGRIDLDRFKTGMATCKNYIPTIQGGLIRRPGSYYVSETKFRNKKSRLIPFEFGVTQAYMLEFGDQYIRFFKDDAIITLASNNITALTQANPAVVTSNAHGYSNGDRVVIEGVLGMTQVNNREFIVAGAATNTFQLHDIDGNNVNSSAYTAYVSGGTVAKIYEISTAYLEARVFQIKYTQSADTMYLTHPEVAPQKLTRTGHTSWTITNIPLTDGPYLPINTSGVTLTPSSTAGPGTTINITASSSIFTADDFGRYVRIQQGVTWGWAQITIITTGFLVQAVVGRAFSATTASSNWRLGLWCSRLGNPSCVTFHEDRLVFGGAPYAPLRFDGSKTGDYENFAPTDPDGTVLGSSAISFTLNSNGVNQIRWIESDEKGLLAGSVANEFLASASSLGEAISPTNISARPTTGYGSQDVQPVKAGKSVLFVQRHGRKLREVAYLYQIDGFKAADLTMLADHISQSGFVQLAYQREPHSLVWAVRADGILVAMTYDRDVDQISVGWHRHVLGGSSDAANSPTKVESVAVIPSSDGNYDEVWVVTQRYVNGVSRRYIEVLAKTFEDTDEQKDAFFVDAGLTYDNPIAITGATKASPVVITANAHGFLNGDKVLISDALGMTDLNGNTYTVANKTTNTFELSGIDGTGFSTYVSGGFVRKYVSTITGLFHLEGQTVQILGDGAVQIEKTVSGGAITLSQPASTIHIGLGYQSDGQILRIEAGSTNGVALGKTRRINRIGILLYRSLGLKIGMSFDQLTALTFRKTSDPMSRSVPLYSGILSQELEADFDFDNQFCFRQDQPLPSTVLALMPQMVTEDRL